MRARKMSVREIRELMELLGCNQKELAHRLQVSEGAITKWLTGVNPVVGPAKVLMDQWLTEARKEARKQPA